MEAALTLPPTNATWWPLDLAGVSARCSARSDAALHSHRRCCRPLDVVAATFSQLSLLRHPRPILRACLTYPTAHAAPARSSRSSHSACAMRHSPIHSPRLTALPQPPRAHLTLPQARTESEICTPASHPCVVAPRVVAAHACSPYQLLLHVLGHAHATTLPTSQPQPELHSTDHHSSQGSDSASPQSAPRTRAMRRRAASERAAASGSERAASERAASEQAASERQQAGGSERQRAGGERAAVVSAQRAAASGSERRARRASGR